ncbi:MAG: HEPN domain-containing protein [Spirochaetales bacterium]|nr:HEPN domain-containing protein [Spirochaetales bacterium]
MDDLNEWIRLAKDDINSAKHLLKLRPVPFEIICFHCQQCAEKALKTLLIKNKIEIIRTHDLLRLCDILSEKYSFDSILNSCARLTNFAVITRYPFSKKIDLNKKDILEYISQAENILNFVLDKVI